MGTPTPIFSSRSLMRGTAAAASLRSTVMRTISEPAPANAATCRAVSSTSAVSVLVMDCTTMGASPPTRTPPTSTDTERRRGCGPASVMYGLLCHRTCQTAPPTSTRPVPHHPSRQCAQMPVTSITGDFGMKPAARAADVSVAVTSSDEASPTAPQHSQIKNTTSAAAE